MPEIIGTNSEDKLYGTTGNDTLRGNESADTLYGSAGDDLLDGGASNYDTVRYDFSSADTLIANGNTVTSDSFDTDTLLNIGYLTVYGSSGADHIESNDLAIWARGNGGKDTLIGGDGNDTLDGDNSLSTNSVLAADILEGNGGDDILSVRPLDTVTGGDGADRFDLSIDDAVANIEQAGVITDFDPAIDSLALLILSRSFDDLSITPGTGEYEGHSIVTVNATGHYLAILENVTLSSFDGLIGEAETLTGTDDDDSLVGGSGDDLFIGSSGTDTMIGGHGDDTFQGVSATDVIDGGAGFDDELDLSALTINVDVDLNAGTISTGGSITGSVTGVENVKATATGGTLVGDNNYNALTGGAGNDHLVGNGGNDRLLSGGGIDTLEGGDGFDQLHIDYGYADGGNGTDIITVAYGDSTLLGGAGSDLFNLDLWSDLHTTIADFSAEEGDLIRISRPYTHADPDFASYLFVRPLSYQEILFNAADSDDGVIINIDGNTITITGYSVSDLTADMFGITAISDEQYASGTDTILDAFYDLGRSWTPGETLTYQIDDQLDTNMVSLIEAALDQVARSANLTFEEAEGGILSFELDPSLSSAGAAEAVDRSGTRIAFQSNDQPATVVFHELGHALGLSHPDESSAFIADLQLAPYTIMQSFGLPGAGPIDSGTWPPELDSSIVTGFMNLDLEALIGLYGESTVSAGDDTYFFSTSDIIFQGLHDTGGVDTINISDPNKVGVALDLTPGGAFSLGTVVDGFFAPILSETVHTTRTTIIERVVSDDGDDFISGNSADNYIAGKGGNDWLAGASGNDTLIGGLGDDSIDAGDGNDTSWAGKGDTGNDTVDGGAGDDEIGAAAGDDMLIGGQGSDKLYGGTGNDIIILGEWQDSDNDGLIDDNELVTSSIENEIAYGGDGSDILYGTNGNETLGGATGNDTINGFGGDDLIYGGGGAARDTVDGGAGNDTLYGGGGDDNVSGGAGNDLIYAGAGNDTVHGGAGNDTMGGSGGEDFFTGGDGADVFSFYSGNGADTITDFDTSEDRLSFEDIDIADLAAVASETTQDGASGVLLTLNANTSVFLIGLELSDISNDLLLG